MSEPGTETVRIVLSSKDEVEWKRVYAELHSRLDPAPPETKRPRDIRILAIDKADLLAAFEPIFLISMGAALLASGSVLGVWRLAHDRFEGGRIPLDSPEGRALVNVIKISDTNDPAQKTTANADTPTRADSVGSALLELLGSPNEAELAYRARLRKHLVECDDLGALRTASGRFSKALKAFAAASCPLSNYGFLDDVVILPTSTNIFGNMSVSGTETIVASHGFLDLLAFHHRATVAFRMCEILSQRGIGEVAGSRKTRTALHMALLHLVGRWLVEQFPLDDLPAADASPKLVAKEMGMLSQGLLFLLLHEHAHSELGHRWANPTTIALRFNLVSRERLDEAKNREFEADGWAALAMRPSIMLPWQATAIVRMFLIVGLGQAANGLFPASHPYVSNRAGPLNVDPVLPIYRCRRARTRAGPMAFSRIRRMEIRAEDRF